MKQSHAANDNLIDRTRKVWKPRLGRDLSREDARQIAENVTGFFPSFTSGPGPACLPRITTIVHRLLLATSVRRTMTAEVVAKALGGRKVGGGWMARCPAHNDREPSLSIIDAKGGKVLVRCHAGCDQADVIAALRSRGVWHNHDRRHGPRNHTKRRSAASEPDQDTAKRIEAALALWRATQPATGTLVERYLHSRGLHHTLPPILRFHVGLKHPSGGIWPAMVALVTRSVDDVPIAIHRTFVASDGSGKAPVEPAKMMLGPGRGCAVRLGPAGDVLMVGEGIETSLAAMQASGHAAWAALSTSGLRTLDLPRKVRDVIVLADGDDAGEAAAQDCAWRWKREGRRVRIARPPRGMDFNDLLRHQTPRFEEVAR
jgi:putative DNA primase/helicase